MQSSAALCVGGVVVGSVVSLASGAWFWLQGRRLPPARPLLPSLAVASSSSRQLVIGHRGCRVGSPPGQGPPLENTLAAFEYALDCGADGIELDTRLTKDGVAVVFHDACIGRCLAHAHPDTQIAELTLEELQKLLPKSGISTNTRVPTLEEALAFAKHRRVKVFIETKDLHRPADLAEKVVDTIQRHDMLEHAWVISFDPRSLYYARSIDPAVQTCLLWVPGILCWLWAKGLEVMPLYWLPMVPLLELLLSAGAHPALLPTFLGVSAVGPHVALRRTYLKAARRRGFATYVWVVNKPTIRDDIEVLAEQGVFAYSTDGLYHPKR